jgi:polyketide synthase 12
MSLALAIVGIGCRFPGAEGKVSFWRLVRDGTDAITEVPPARWSVERLYHPDPAHPGTMNTKWGGFIHGVDQFDPDFFRISRREAARMDPQQRLLLMTVWEALEDAGQVPELLAGTPAGVFVGISGSDYGHMQHTDTGMSDPYVATGNALSIAANRISYFFDLRGPSMAMDTACSSSMMALHQACGSLARGESQLAIAAGVNLILSPAITVNFSKAGFMAPDGRCKTFDARADGYVRSDGVGVVVLRPLEAALAAGDRVYAVIRGTGTSHVGRTNGLTAPGRWGQEAAFRRACQVAEVAPGAIDYVETQGTGTPLGDTIEAEALGSALGEGRTPGTKAAIGSVKTNIGHTEAASGMAGLIKVALSLYHRQIPPSLHFSKPNPQIRFGELPIKVQTELEPWPTVPGKPALASVNSFGFGGANVHVILEAAPPASDSSPAVTDETPSIAALLLPLSARAPEALRRLAESYVAAFARGTTAVESMCRAAAQRRGHHPHRVAVLGSSASELVTGLNQFLAGEPAPGVMSGKRAGRRLKIGFVFSDEVPGSFAVVRELLQTEPTFRDALAECDKIVAQLAGWSPLGELAASDPERLGDLEISEPLLVSVQVALCELWKSWEVRPQLVVGLGVGEAAAAYAGGALTLAEALKVAVSRSRWRKRAAGLEQARARALETGGMPPLAPTPGELDWELNFVMAQTPKVLTISGYTGKPAAPGDFGPGFWGRQVTAPVLMDAAIDVALGKGNEVLIEVGLQPVLTAVIEEKLKARSQEGAALATLMLNTAPDRSLRRSLAALYAHGHAIAWTRVYPGPCPHVDLPTYTWQVERCWFEVGPRQESITGWGAGLLGPAHKVLGIRLSLASGTHAWTLRLEPRELKYVGERRIDGRRVMPISGYVDVALAAAGEALGDFSHVVRDLRFERTLVFEGDGVHLQVLLNEERLGEREFQIYGKASEQAEWALHVSGKLAHPRRPEGIALT